MAQLIKLKQRMSSINATRKITSAMKLVSSSRLVKKRKQYETVKDYSLKVEEVILDCLNSDESIQSKLIEKNDVSSNLYVVITSSLGLCGGYNVNVIKYLNTLIKEGDQVLIIGSKGVSKLSDYDDLITNDETLFDNFSFSKVKYLAQELKDMYLNKKYGNIYLVYTLYKNALTFVPTSDLILPFKIENKENNMYSYSPIYCPNKEEVLNLLIPKYIETNLYTKIAQTRLAEEASRRNSMEQATDNADELMSELQLTYNKIRQASITYEINEIVAGQIKDEE